MDELQKQIADSQSEIDALKKRVRKTELIGGFGLLLLLAGVVTVVSVRSFRNA